ncbi:MAG: signal peptide peptidase SppA [Candidatus Cloacimonetes bacterium]|nr:signal peptide peptidase SppA [Candidatus Cloacimonadota bacterium]MBL7149282.1 signal peptide peptidase SppA [Candidatus Cloacimonadota bacterium]
MKGKWFAFGCLTSVVIIIVMIFSTINIIGSMSKSMAKKKQFKVILPDSYLHVKLTGEIVEYNEFSESFFGEDAIGTHSVVQKINKASYDKNIKGIILEPQWMSCGMANINEIIEAIEHFKSSGKKVYAYFSMAGNRDYILASVADSIYLNPSASGGLFLTGVGGSVLFYKDLLDKIGIEMKVIHAGKYKGFGENFSRSSFSKPVKENLDRLYTTIYDKMIIKIAENRDLSIKQIKNIYENRKEIFISGEKALAYNLVDQLCFREDLFNELGIKKTQLVSLRSYKLSSRSKEKDRIAVVYAQGSIAPSNSFYMAQNLSASKIDEVLDKLEIDNSIKAVVLRVNSPGGSALESEIILNRIKQLRSVKPVIISMGNVAASGGYYISAESDYTYADPFTITGSIGVVAIIANISKLSQNIGLNSEQIKKGKYSDVFNPYKEPNAEEFEALKKNIEETYIEFKTRVAEGREMTLEDVEMLAQGQVWSSEDALERNLIDGVGMLNDAIIKAAEIAGVTEYSVHFYPEKKSIFEEFLKDKFDIDVVAELMKSDITKEIGLDRSLLFYKNIKTDPIQAIMPFEPGI